jgi:serine protease Do
MSGLIRLRLATGVLFHASYNQETPVKLLVALLMSAACAAAQQPAAPPDSLHEFSASLEGLAQRVNHAVVQIFSSGYALSDDSQAGQAIATVTRQRATGTGVVLSGDGYIVTNAHVVSNARSVRVRLPSDRARGQSILPAQTRLLDARVIGVDRGTDLAVLKIPASDLTHLELGDSESLRQGQLVLAFGNPLGLENSVSMGIVSSVARQIKADDPMIYIQTDAPINPGNSGGPLVDAYGRVVGINTFILSQSGGSEGVGFAIPSNIVSKVWTELRDKGHVHRSEIGVAPQSITPALAAALGLPLDWGVILADVTPSGPGDAAGLKVGDVVLSLDGKPMENARQMQVDLYRYSAGDQVKLQVLRNGEKRAVPVAVAQRDDDPMRFADLVDPVKNAVPKLGILGVPVDKTVAALLDELRKPYGIVVAARYGESPYSGEALQLGDVIIAVNAGTVTSIDALNQALAQLKDTDPLVLQVQRGERLLYLTLENQ